MPEKLLLTRRPAHRRWATGLAAGAASLALVLAGCGGDDTPSDDSTSASDTDAADDTESDDATESGDQGEADDTESGDQGEADDTESDEADDASSGSGDVGPIDDPVAFWQDVADAMAGVGSYTGTVSQELPMGAGTSTSTVRAQVLDDGTTNTETVTTMPADAMGGAGSGDIEFVSLMVDGVGYFQYPPELGMTEEGQWMQMDLGDMLGGAASQTFDADMMAGLAAVTTMEIVDTPEVDGQSTRLIEYSVAGTDLADQMPGELGDSMAGQMPDTVHYQVWVNDDDLPVRTVVDMDSLGATEITFAEFGADVAVEAPDPSSVVSMEDMVGG